MHYIYCVTMHWPESDSHCLPKGSSKRTDRFDSLRNHQKDRSNREI